MTLDTQHETDDAATVLANTATEAGASISYDPCPRRVTLRRAGQAAGSDTGDDAQEIGRLVHSAMAFVLLGVQRGVTDRDESYVLDAAVAEGRDPRLVSEARRLMAAYWRRWKRDGGGFGLGVRILGVEERLECDVLGVTHTGRADVIIGLPAVGVTATIWEAGTEILTTALIEVIVDHKTRSSMPGDGDDELARGFATSPQFLGLAYAYRATHGVIPWVMWNAIIKTRVPDFRRVAFQPTARQLDDWAQAHAARSRQLAGADWPNYAACVEWTGRRCQYFDHCHPPG